MPPQDMTLRQHRMLKVQVLAAGHAQHRPVEKNKKTPQVIDLVAFRKAASGI